MTSTTTTIPETIVEAHAGDLHDERCEQGTGSVPTACQCAVREVTWVAREALALIGEQVPMDSPRQAAYLDRKRGLFTFIESTR